MEKKPIDAIVSRPRGLAGMPPRFTTRPAARRLAAARTHGDDVDREILDWIMSHVRSPARPKTH